MALHSLYCADVPLRNCSLTHSPSPKKLYFCVGWFVCQYKTTQKLCEFSRNFCRSWPFLSLIVLNVDVDFLKCVQSCFQLLRSSVREHVQLDVDDCCDFSVDWLRWHRSNYSLWSRYCRLYRRHGKRLVFMFHVWDLIMVGLFRRKQNKLKIESNKLMLFFLTDNVLILTN